MKFEAGEPSKPVTARNWSAQQQAIFEWFARGRGSLVVRARAGSGKTTSIIEGVSKAPERSILIAAYNKHIQEDMNRKLTNQSAAAKTLHAVGRGCVLHACDKAEVNSDRGYALASQALSDTSVLDGISLPDRYDAFLAKGSLIRQYPVVDRSVVTLVAKVAAQVKELRPLSVLEDKDTARLSVMDVMGDFDMSVDQALEINGWSDERVAAYALKAMQLSVDSADDGIVDFPDMIFLPLVKGWTYRRYDMIVIDEAQDMSEPMLEFAMRMLRPNGRIAVVGDDKQAVYGFRGADSGCIDRLKTSMKAIELPLTTTYRCAASIVREAQRLVPDIMPRPNAPEGIVRTIERRKLAQEVRHGDVVLSRVNSVLLGACFDVIHAGKAVTVLGKEIGDGLNKIVKDITRGKTVSLAEFTSDLEDWKDAQIAKFGSSKSRGMKARLARLLEAADALDYVACSLLENNAAQDTIGLTNKIAFLFHQRDRRQAVTFSTIHKMKGQESDRVFVLRDTLYVYGMKQEDQEEKNIEYVAITRAINELVWVADSEPNKSALRDFYDTEPFDE